MNQDNRINEIKSKMSYIGSIAPNPNVDIPNIELESEMVDINENSSSSDFDEEQVNQNEEYQNSNLLPQKCVVSFIEMPEQPNKSFIQNEMVDLEHDSLVQPKEYKFKNEFKNDNILTELTEPYIELYPRPYPELTAKQIKV